jgi:hypothetical protein
MVGIPESERVGYGRNVFQRSIMRGKIVLCQNCRSKIVIFRESNEIMAGKINAKGSVSLFEQLEMSGHRRGRINDANGS